MNRNGPLSDYYHRLYQSSIGLSDNPKVEAVEAVEAIDRPYTGKQIKNQTQATQLSQPMDIPLIGKANPFGTKQPRIECQNCGKDIQAASLSRHMKSKRCMQAGGSGGGGNSNRRGLLDLTMLSQPRSRQSNQSNQSHQYVEPQDYLSYPGVYDQGDQEEEEIQLDY